MKNLKQVYYVVQLIVSIISHPLSLISFNPIAGAVLNWIGNVIVVGKLLITPIYKH
jgi:hypothetical protein